MVVSILTIWQVFIQYNADYDAAVVLSPGTLPVKQISTASALELDLEVTNTAKVNIDYFLRVDSNTGCVSGNENTQRDLFVPCIYESQVVQLSKPEAGNHKQKHKVSLQASSGVVGMKGFLYESDPRFFLSIEVVNAKSGKVLLQSVCYYTYIPETKTFNIYMPVLDTSGESRVLQSKC